MAARGSHTALWHRRRERGAPVKSPPCQPAIELHELHAGSAFASTTVDESRNRPNKPRIRVTPPGTGLQTAAAGLFVFLNLVHRAPEQSRGKRFTGRSPPRSLQSVTTFHSSFIFYGFIPVKRVWTPHSPSASDASVVGPDGGAGKYQ